MSCREILNRLHWRWNIFEAFWRHFISHVYRRDWSIRFCDHRNIFCVISSRYKLENSKKLLSCYEIDRRIVSFPFSFICSRLQAWIFDYSIHRDLRKKGGYESERQQDSGSCCHRGYCFSLGTSLYRTNALARIVKEGSISGRKYERIEVWRISRENPGVSNL